MLRAAKPADSKVTELERLESSIKEAKSILMADFRGMPVSEVDELRKKCFENNLQFRVAKNRLVKIVFDNLGYPNADDFLTGPTGFCMGFEDPIIPIKLISDFAKAKDRPAIKGCVLDGMVYGPEKVDKLKSIPPRDVLIGMVAGAIVSPLSGFVFVLNEILRSFVGVVESIQQKIEADGGEGEGLSAIGGSVENIIESIEKMTVLELVELKNALEEKFGVTAAAPVAVAGGAAGAPAAEAAEAEEEQTEFDVILTSVGDKKIQVIKEVRAITSLGLKEAKALVDEHPKPIKEAVSKEEAEEIKAKIEEVGGQVDIK